jgi:hypothetical protein
MRNLLTKDVHVMVLSVAGLIAMLCAFTGLRGLSFTSYGVGCKSESSCVLIVDAKFERAGVNAGSLQEQKLFCSCSGALVRMSASNNIIMILFDIAKFALVRGPDVGT